MKTTSFYIRISVILLGLFMAGSSFAASPYYVSDPTQCLTDAFSQSCVGGLKVCGVNGSSVISCYDTATFTAPGSPASVSSGTATTTGGYYVDCYSYDAAAPYCNNNGAFSCLQSNTCNSLQKVTTCTASQWANSTCGACKTGYNDCDGNAVNGCSGATEHDGVACTTALSLPGTWQNCVCVGTVLKLGADSLSGNSVIQGGAASMIFVNGLNVGIGTSLPNDIFSIGNSGVAPAGSSNTGHNFTSTYLSSDDYALVNYGVVKTLIGSATSTLTALWSGTLNGNIWNGAAGVGNVGIGTTNPAGRLDVSAGLGTQTAGDLVVDTANNIVYIGKLDSASGNTNLIFRNRLGGVKSKWANAGAGSIWFGDFVNGYGVGIQQSGITTETTLPGNALFYVDKGGLGGTVASFINGNVGIGTTNPVAQLQVYSATAQSLRDSFTNLRLGYDGGAAAGSGGAQITFAQRYSDGDPTANVRVGAVRGFKSYGAGSFGGGVQLLYQASSNVDMAPGLTLIDNGNVGIGTTTPISKLQVYGNGTLSALFTNGNVGIGTTAPNDIFSIGNSGSAPAGSDKTGHNFTSTYLTTDNYALTNYGIVKSLISDATSSLPTVTNYWSGTKNGNIWNGDAGVGNVGIGTTTPGQKLEVVGNIMAGLGGRIGFRYSSGDNNLYNYITANGTSPMTIVGGMFDSNPVREAIRFSTPNSSYVVTPAMSIQNSGNVGIGTTNPGQKLQISGGNIQIDNNTGVFSFDTSGGVVNAFHFNNSNNFIFGYRISGSGDFPVRFYNGSSERMRIDTSGNVGIGTTTPNQKLSLSVGNVDGIKITSSNAPILRMYSSAAAADSRNWQFASNWSVAGDFQFLKTNANTGDPSTVVWSVNKDGNMGVGYTDPGTAKLSINGNVGIGTTAPNDVFSIGNSGTAPAGSSNTGHNFTSTYLNSDDYALANYGVVKTLISSATSGAALWGGSTGGNIWNLNTAYSVGIGTTDATELTNHRLVVAKDVTYPNDVTNSQLSLNGATTPGKQLSLGYDTNGNGFGFIAAGNRGVTWTNLSLQPTGGNVGIGTTTPVVKLDVNGGFRAVDTSSGLSFIFGELGGVNRMRLYSTGPTIRFLDSGNSYARLGFGGLSVGGTYAVSSAPTSGAIFEGNVGIGTTNPIAKLDVVQRATGLLAKFSEHSDIIGEGSEGYISIGYSPINIGSHFSYSGSYGFIGMNGGARAIAITNAGNIGIGTTTPLSKVMISDLNKTPNGYIDNSNLSIITSDNAASDVGGSLLFGGANGQGVSPFGFGLIKGAKEAGGTWAGYLSFFTTNNGSGMAEHLRISGNGNVGINNTVPNDTFSIGNSGSAPAGSSNTGHNFTSTYLSSDDYALTNYGIVKTLIGSATSSILSLWGGTINGNIWNGAAGAGNVGIGTTNPTLAKLQIAGGLFVGTNGTTVSPSIMLNETGVGLYRPASSILGFVTANAERMRINATGNVGIGTTTPLSKVMISDLNKTPNGYIDNSNLSIITSDNAASDVGGSLLFGGANGQGVSPFGFGLIKGAKEAGGTWAGYLSFFTTNNGSGMAEHLRISGNGNVGIGTTAPNGNLQIGDNLGAGGTGALFSDFTSSSHGSLKIYDYATSMPTIQLSSVGTTYFNTGNVGIGTTTPLSKVMISDLNKTPNGYIDNSNLSIITSDNAASDVGGSLLFGGANGQGVSPFGFGLIKGAKEAGGTWAGYLSFFTTNNGSGMAEHLRISGNGNVGINNTVPNDTFSIGNSGSAPAGSSNTGHNFTSTYLSSDDYALTNYGIVKTLIAAATSSISTSVGGGVYATSTPSTSLGNPGSYTSANALCVAVDADTHVCTSEEILNTVNSGQAGNIPSGSTLWINNGPPAYTANANDCIGWTSTASTDFGAVWNRPSGYADGFGSLNRCNIARKFACCK